MGLLDRLKELTQPYNDYDDDLEEESAPPPRRKPAPEEPVSFSDSRARNPFSGFSSEFAEQPQIRTPPRDSKVVNIHATTQLQVVLVKPERFETASEIAGHLCEKRTVVVNFEKADKATSRRLLDFISGVAYAQDGKIKKIAVSTYIITPYNVDIMGDLMDELESNGLYF